MADKKIVEIFDDIEFNHVFGLKGLDSTITGQNVFGELKWDGAKPGHSWTITEWNSAHLLKDEVIAIKTVNSGIHFKNESKSVVLYPGKNMISLKTLCSKEYKAPRKSHTDPWIHLLLEQKVPENRSVFLADVAHMFVELEFEIPFDKNMMTEKEFNPDMHTSQVSWYFTIENAASEKLDFEGRPDYYWFGLPLYDHRFGIFKGEDIQYDRGTQKLIYKMDESSYIKDDKIQIGKTYSFKIDIIENLKKGFDLTKKEGWLKGAEWKDMKIGSTNIGWENPGTLDSEFFIKKISVKAELKD